MKIRWLLLLLTIVGCTQQVPQPSLVQDCSTGTCPRKQSLDKAFDLTHLNMPRKRIPASQPKLCVVPRSSAPAGP